LPKTYYASKIGKKAEDIIVVSVMPCTAKKFEANRPEMNASGVTDVDYVLTTRELARMIKQAGIQFDALPDEKMDSPIGLSSGRQIYSQIRAELWRLPLEQHGR
jgi:iron only hydrogenase large subunit-like protein